MRQEPVGAGPYGEGLVHEVFRSQIVVGDGAIAVQILPDEATTVGAGIDPAVLSLQALPPLRALRDRRPLVGRAETVEQVADGLLAGRSTRLFGAPGLGRSAVAQAVVDRLAEGGSAGAQLLGGAEPHSLDSLYRRLARLFFGVVWYQPDEPVLRAATARLRPGGVIVVTDCELEAADLTRLAGTFPDCVFLLTSTPRTGPGGVTAREVPPLTPGQARELVERRLGRPLRGAEPAQVARAYELAEGQVARLIVLAAFLERAAADPRQTERVEVSVADQIALLVSGLAGPARRVLTALAGFGPCPAPLIPLLTGTAGDTAALADLDRAGLVAATQDVWAAIPEAAQAAALDGGKPDPRVAGESLLAAFAAGAGLRPAPRLSLAVAEALCAERDWDLAARFVRAAAPSVLASGQLALWGALLVLGVRSATAAGRDRDLRWFLEQQHTEALVRGDRVAAASALAALAACLRTHVIAAPGAGPPHPGRPRRALRGARRVFAAGHGAVGALAVAAVVGGAVAVAAVTGNATPGASGPGPSGSAHPRSATTGAGTAATWDVALQSQPLTALAESAYSVTAQYPVVSAGVADAALRRQVDQRLQQPVVAWAVAVFNDVASQAQFGDPIAPGKVADEQTTVDQAGNLLSLYYSFHASDQAGGDSDTALVVRKDTGAAVPQKTILTARAATPAGAARLISLLAARGYRTADGPGCDALTPRTLAAGVMTLTGQGVQFHLGAEFVCRTTAGTGTTIPFGQLSGLVDPQVQAWATGTEK
ncbi:hypothetical protein [Streptomyces sp. IBSBF 2435]|uniref:hypothetical protein n=1 Tax=Streptomyces sp. IBSBF 2435 TaxID=2903531 RepID=UPI002FDC5DAC